MRLYVYVVHLIGGGFAIVAELFCLFLCGETLVQFRAKGIAIQIKRCRYAEKRFAFEFVYFSFPFNYQSYCHTLHAPCRKRRTYSVPQHRRKLKTYNAIQNPACLLGIYKIQINGTRIFYSVQDCRFRYFVKNNAVFVGYGKFKHLRKMPRNSFSLAILIACEPYGFCTLRCLSEFAHYVGFVFGYLILRLECLGVYSVVLFFQVAYMAERRHYFIVRAEIALYSLGFCRRFDDYEIFLH